jgi:hypothetical protein
VCDVMEARRKLLIEMFNLDITPYMNLRMLSFDADHEADRGEISNIGQTKEATDIWETFLIEINKLHSSRLHKLAWQHHV